MSKTFDKKPEHMTSAHGEDLVLKNDPVIRFRGALDHAEAEVILTQALLQHELDIQEGKPSAYTEELIRRLQELLCTLRKVMTAEYSGDALNIDRLFGYTLDELQERSHNAKQYYGVATMTQPDFTYGETYARLNLIRTELRLVEVAAVELFCGEEGKDPLRPDLLHLLNRLSSAVHCLMCRHLSETAQ
ncbi:MAG: hypothetical protein J6T17_07830 [Clostridia bacterium]|nr:hypothetical protein [Clostridia bacterium]